ncbi:uncharacterized conserved protein [Firmicutes bacterium CAG:631]|nr:uncharacterized conserved protein [Firmicutes bacterium CAG:631]
MNENKMFDQSPIDMLENDFKKIIVSIKEEIVNTQIKIAMQSNRSLIQLYFKIGKILYDNYEYGNKFIDQIAQELKLEYPNSIGYSVRNLKYMKKIYIEYKDDELMQQLVAQVPWGHNVVLLDKVKGNENRKIYLQGIIKNGWGRSMLVHQIELNYHLRIGKSNNNFELTLPKKNSDLVNYMIKDPYIFDFISLQNDYREQELEKAMLMKIKNVLIELGKGFSFVGNQYKILMKDKDYYIDLLFYHLELRCYVVVELKATSFKPEYIGQLSFYVTAIDHILKKDVDNPTIGLLLCKEKDKLSVEWSLQGIDLPIGVSSYQLNQYVAQNIVDKLPTEEEINLHIDMGSGDVHE